MIGERSDIVVTTIATANPMGQQEYEGQLQRGLKAALGQQVSTVVATNVRAKLPADRRLPIQRLANGPIWLSRAVGRAAFGRSGVCHRLDLRLPPAGKVDILTVHDLARLDFEDEVPLPRFARSSLESADLVICPSRAAAEQLSSFARINDVRVIPNGVDPTFAQNRLIGPKQRNHIPVGTPFVLLAGGTSRRKNLGALAEAWRSVTQAVPEALLVMTGPDTPGRRELLLDLPRTKYLGIVTKEAVAGLMAEATVVVVPSLMEGFGLPALEAMASGSALVCSDIPSLREVAGGHAIFVEPTPDGLGEGILRSLRGERSDGNAAARHARTFTWQRCVDAHIEAYREHVVL